MILPFPCTHIYFRYANERELNIIFLHAPSGSAIYYDGLSYAFVQKAIFAQETFAELDYGKKHQGEVMMIESIHGDFDISYIKFMNGDIFQLSYMMDDENNPQRLFIHEPDHWSYASSLKRSKETNNARLLTQSDDPSIPQWFTLTGTTGQPEQVSSNQYYFKRDWDESTGDPATDSWGSSTFYFATDENYQVLRQLQHFANGNVLKYDVDYLDDKFGGLSDADLDPDEFGEFQIPKAEFDAIWNNTTYHRFPEIVCTADVVWGQPRLEGRKLAVGDIVNLIDAYDKSISVTLKDHELSMQQVQQALHYCKDLQCKIDKPEQFCHNCLLRLYQTGKPIDPSDPEQPNWQKAAKLYEQYFRSPQQPPPPPGKSWWKFW